MLQTYGTPERGSGVKEFALLPDAILLLFRNGAAYLYTGEMPGPAHVAQMQRLALQGRGLTTYVSRFVADRYAEKLSPAQVAAVRSQVAKDEQAVPGSSRP